MAEGRKALRVQLDLQRESIMKCMQQMRDVFAEMARLFMVKEEEEEEEEEDQEEEEEDDIQFHDEFWAQSSSVSDDVELHDEDEDEDEEEEQPKYSRKRAREQHDDDDEDADAEHALPAFRVWRSSLEHKKFSTWEDLSSCQNGWFSQRYIVPLDMVRSALGAQSPKQVYVRSRWDYALNETLCGRKLHVTALAGNGVTKQCDLCGQVKRCTYECGTWRLGAHCAKLLRAWLKWCKALFHVLRLAARDCDAAEVQRLDRALAKVLKAHANKGNGK